MVCFKFVENGLIVNFNEVDEMCQVDNDKNVYIFLKLNNFLFNCLGKLKSLQIKKGQFVMMNDRLLEKLMVYFYLNFWFIYVSDLVYKNK